MESLNEPSQPQLRLVGVNAVYRHLLPSHENDLRLNIQRMALLVSQCYDRGCCVYQWLVWMKCVMVLL